MNTQATSSKSKFLAFAVGALLIGSVAAQTDQSQDVSLLRDRCFCYCCPSASNSNGADRTCNAKDPPLAGFVDIFGPSWPNSCTANACYSYFAVRCPPPGLNDQFSGVKPECANCPGGLRKPNNTDPSGPEQLVSGGASSLSMMGGAAAITATVLGVLGALMTFA
ncbi:hypothetical protein HK102_006065 [Quaeritorhiza haematococci]|nr:hypothetical protein HK102_006065 [Quaeritorhiza haematococci]